MGNACTSEAKDDKKKAVKDDDASRLSYVGNAANDILQTEHGKMWHKAWNVTTGKVTGEVNQTPHSKVSWIANQDPPEAHDAWFPQNMAKIMSKTQVWCDVTSLGPPDGQFMAAFKQALGVICQTASKKDKPIIVRMMFGNIVGQPTNCDAVIGDLTEDLPEDANIKLWVGAWRKGGSWNHSKIIAVDGYYLHNGGHNLWDKHYLSFDPVHDLSMEAVGRVAHDGHLFANAQWEFIEKEQKTWAGQLVSMLPDSLPMLAAVRVSVSEWPEGTDEFPPAFKKSRCPEHPREEGHVPMITMGRYGDMIRNARPSDEAFVAMFDSAKTIIHMALQDLGPITLPGMPGPIAVPGFGWPAPYLEAFGRAIWEREVDIEIAVSNPGSIPGGLSPTQACYGNGWTCEDVASEIIQTIKLQYDEVDDDALRMCVRRNLRVCYIKQTMGNKWSDGKGMGMHAKHFIIDDQAYYIGSQNLYVCDLAEWGILIDDKAQTKKCMAEYWDPLWKASYLGVDCDEDKVMDGLDIDRNGGNPRHANKETKLLMEQAKKQQYNVDPDSEHHHNED